MNYDLTISILIIDDNPADMFFLKEVITDDTNLEAEILEASSLKEGLSLIEKKSIDIIFLDLFLPDSSGLETFEKLNDIDISSSIIVLSGLKDEFIALQTVRSGAQDFILKGEYNGKLLEKTIVYSIERKKNEELLRASNQKYLELFQNSPLPLFIINPEKNSIEQSNNAATSLFGYSPEEFTNLEYSDLFLSENVLNGKKYLIACRKDDKKIFVHVVKQKMRFGDEQLQLIQVEDVTERVHFERHRMEVINSIQDDERQNFAMELHDGLAQEMVLINLYLEQVKKETQDESALEKIQEIVNSTMIQIRRLTYSVAPPLLDEGFIQGLKVLFERFDSVNDMDIRLEISNPNNLPENYIAAENGYNAFRIIQEFLNNSIKHSKASKIHADLKFTEKKVNITIEDDGVGFDQSEELRKGIGLDSMQKRAELFDLKFDLNSAKGNGTTLNLEIRCSRSQISALED